MRASRAIATVALALISTAFPAAAAAQPSHEVLHTFVRPPEQPEGAPVEVEPGIFALSMRVGGAANRGAILRFDRQANGSFTSAVLHAFTGPDGDYPGPVMRGLDGALYGTTLFGGAANQGTAFRLTLDGAFTTLYSFSGNHERPLLLLRAANGSFFGTVIADFQNPDFAHGKMFVLTPQGDVAIGDRHLNRLRLAQTSSGEIYGLANGMFFRLTPEGHIAELLSLSGFETDASSLVAGRDGNFYISVSDRVYANQVNRILRVTPTGSSTVLYTFPDPTGDGVQTLIEGADGHLYGVTFTTNHVFRLTKAGAFTALHTFWWWDGNEPISLMQAPDGRFLGATITGGTSARGTLFELSSAGFSVRSHFADPAPLLPMGTLVRGVDGALYGTSCGGGDYNTGTVFRMTEAGVLTVVHSFRHWDGICPGTGLTRARDGSLWGTALGSVSGRGTIFRISPTGVFTLMRILGPGNGSRPLALLLATDGNLYGTTSASDGLTAGALAGAVFRITAGGVFTVMHTFQQDSGLRRVWAGLAQGPDGALYGTGVAGNPGGGAFRLTLSGDYTEFPFISPELTGALRLVAASDGGFYAASAFSEIIRMTATGAPSLVYALPASDGFRLFGDLMQATDGRLYGTAFQGGASNRGTLFRVTTGGLFDKLHDFSGLDGSNPYGGLFESAPGTFYGTTAAGGPGNGGTIFRLVLNPPPF